MSRDITEEAKRTTNPPLNPGEGSASDEPEAARGGSEADDEPAT